MPPRTRPAPAPDTFHSSFDPGVTGRRTGVAPPVNVRRTSNGIEAFSDYFPSPHKDLSFSPTHRTPVQMNKQKRARNDRPDMFHEIGERGRKTGISPPANVAKDKNGFEEFDAYLVKATQQTNKDIQRERRRSARRSSIHNRKQSVATIVDDGNDDDDADLDLDESMSLDTQEYQQSRQIHRSSPRPHGAKRPSRSPGSADRSTRTLADSELVDFDAVPERPLRARPRHRSLEGDDQPMTVRDADGDDDDDEQDGGGMGPANGERGGNDGYDDSDNEAEFPGALDDIMEEEEDPDVEAAQAGGSEQASRPQPAKRRKSNARPPPPAGARRSARCRVTPLRHWKNERVVYGRSMTPDGSQRVIGMVDVVRFPKEEVQPLAALRRHGRKAYAKVKSESVQPSNRPAPQQVWDADTRPDGIVYSFTKNKECERTIVHTKRMVTIDVEDRAGVPDSFQFQRVCKDADYVAGGLMFIPVGGGKPLKPAKDNFYIFTVLEGAVSVHIHRTTFAVGPMGMFWVPRGNAYSIQNISQETAKLSFAQARRAIGEEPLAGSDEDEERSHASTPSSSKADKKGKKKANRKNNQEQTGGDDDGEELDDDDDGGVEEG